MKQIHLNVTRYYTKSVDTIISYPDDLDLDKVEEFILSNTDNKKYINRRLENTSLELEKETCEYFLEEIKDLSSGELETFESWNIIE